MKKLLRIKTLAVCAVLLSAMFLHNVSIAQRSDMFFKADNEDIYNNRDESVNLETFGNQPFGEKPVPVGSGLLVLVAAGAGYAIARRKNVEKKGLTMLLAFAMLFGMTQCKKRVETVNTNYGNMIHFTVNVGKDRHEIIPNEDGYVPVRYLVGDEIYVGNGSKYIGTLTCTVASDADGNNASFEGDILQPNTDDQLHFYFAGGITPSKTLEVGTTTDFTVDISDQASKLPVLSYTSIAYNDINDVNITLQNKCALVEFKYSTAVPTNKKVKISNMYTEAVIDFAHPGITHTEKLDAINLYRANTTDKWAILMYDDKPRHSLGMVYNRQGGAEYGYPELYDYYNGVIIPELSADDNYLYGSTAINVNNAEANKNNRVFVVSANGNVVMQFAPGNLMYDKSTGIWSFMEHQYDVVEKASTEVGEDYALQNVVDHFGWGCTGYKDSQYGTSQEYYMPYSTNHSNSNAQYGPTGSHDLSVLNKSDWGTVANEVELGGFDDWRLLTKDECDYLLKYRDNAYGKRGTVQIYKPNIDPYYQNGVVFFPDDWVNSINFNTDANAWNNNKYDNYDALAVLLESTGALYLPGAGCREITNGAMKVKSVNSNGNYWLSTYSSDVAGCYWYISGSNGIDTKAKARSVGLNVRLAR